jgi:hypothetical protein
VNSTKPIETGQDTAPGELVPKHYWYLCVSRSVVFKWPWNKGSGRARIGYARVSTADQIADLQHAALEAASCTRIFTDHGVSGTRAGRPEPDRIVGQLAERTRAGMAAAAAQGCTAGRREVTAGDRR